MGALVTQLQELMGRDADAKFSDDDMALLRQLVVELKSQQTQMEMREAQIAWLQAESKRARLNAVLDAQSELKQLHGDAIAADALALPCAPIAAAEDAFSIAVDWAPPASDTAARYHLQWRSDEDRDWVSSAASEMINVPCCTKGHLRTNSSYRFRVRAADSKGRWGPWSTPTESTSPSVLLSNLPSRPQLRSLAKGRVEARWSPPEGASAAGFELQWRQCDGRWGEPGCSMECTDVIASTPSLPTMGAYYSFRVRATVKRYSGVQRTDWSPPSAPIQAYAKQAKKKDEGVKPKKQAPKEMPIRKDEDASESVIEADLRGVLSGYHPTAQAAVEAKLAQVKQQRSEDAANLKTLEERNRAISTKSREDQLNELVKMKREMLNRAVEQDAPLEKNGMAVKAQPAAAVTESWD